MPGRKGEAEQSQARLRRRIAETIDNAVFRDHVQDLREVLHIDRAKRDEWYSKILEHKKGLIAEKAVELPPGWRPFEEEEPRSGIEESVLWGRVRAIAMVQSRLSLAERFTLSLGQLMLAQQGVEVNEQFLLGALCHDFEGEEREAFIDFIVPLEKAVEIHYWYEPLTPFIPYTRWVEQNKMEPNRIYLDVTFAQLSDVQACWPEVGELQNRLGVAKPQVGRPVGTKPARHAVVRGMTWAEVRAYVRENRGELTRLEIEYIAKETARRKAKSPQSYSRHEAAWRDKAIGNFYKQVIIHPKTKDLKLRLRNRGRPRKAT